MNLPVIAIRPEPRCSATIAAGREAGLEIEGIPLFTIRPLAWTAPAPESVDALLIGSANAIRYAGTALETFQGKPVYAVGQVTALTAAGAGFAVSAVGSGGLQLLLDDGVPAPTRLLRLAGAEHVALHPADGITIETRNVYESVAMPMPDSLAVKLSGGAVVLLHSAAAARHFAAQCDARYLHRSAIRIAALAPRVAQAAGGGWSELGICTHPAEPAILALARSLCHGR